MKPKDRWDNPAFPVDFAPQTTQEIESYAQDCGLTKREYFYAKTLQGLLADGIYTNPALQEQVRGHGFDPDKDGVMDSLVAITVSVVAEAVLKELEKR
jgi:hypothetical protein